MSEWEIGWDDNGSGTKVATSLDRAAQKTRGKRGQPNPEIPPPTSASQMLPSLQRVPDRYEPTGDEELTEQDEVNLQQCLAGIALLDAASWIAGKALDTIATARLFRRMPRKDDPTKFYDTIEQFAEIHCGMSRSKHTRLRATWEIAAKLASKGLPTVEGQLRHLTPMRGGYGVNAAVTYFELLHELYGDALTGEIIRKAVGLLPEGLDLGSAPEKQLAAILAGLNTQGDERQPKTTGLPVSLRREVDRRAIRLADALNSSRLPRNTVIQALLEAFTDDHDETVYNVVLSRLRRGQ
jgi:hypothetical protein